jgi:hypothetical protein
MGIKGLFPFLKRWEQPIKIQDIARGKSVGLDIFWFLHRSKGDLSIVVEDLIPVLEVAKTVHAVFDGPLSLERKLKRRAKREQEEADHRMMELIEGCDAPLSDEAKKHLEQYVAQMRRKLWKPSWEYMDQVREWLTSYHVIFHTAEEEADDLLIELEKEGIIDVILSNDSDLIAMGARSLVRPYGPLDGGWLYDSYIKEKLGCTVDQWTDFLYLCRHMKEPDVLLAYSLIRVYQTADYALQRYEAIHNESLI